MSDRSNPVVPLRRSPLDQAFDGYLDRYANVSTRNSYAVALRAWFTYCDQRALDPFAVARAQLERYSRHLEDGRGLKPSTVSQHQIALAGFYRFAFVDGLIDRDPMEFVKRRKVPDKSTTTGLDKFELADMIAAAEHDPNPRAHALMCLLGLNGMRISGALGIDIDQVNVHRFQQPTITIVLKGEDELTVPLALRTAEAVRILIGDRASGPLFVTATGRRWRRNHAHAVVVRVARAAGIKKRISPHSMRHAFVTNALDQGVPMRDVMGSTGHKDPRSMLRYDRSRGAIERNATWSVSALVEGLIRPSVAS